MAKLYEIPREDTHPELTGSLADSFKEGLILPAERKFSLLEREIATLRERLEKDTHEITSTMSDHFSRLEAEATGLKKMFRLVASLSLACLAGIITTLVALLNWY